LQGNFGEGAIKNFINSNAQLNPNSFTPSQNFLTENFTLPQGLATLQIFTDLEKLQAVASPLRVICV
jgi:hypothetical protein